MPKRFDWIWRWRACLTHSHDHLKADNSITAEKYQVAKTTKTKRREYTMDDVKLLKAHSKARTPVTKISKLMKRSEGSLRQKALSLGLGLGHQR
jgi:hypothetical protein